MRRTAFPALYWLTLAGAAAGQDHGLARTSILGFGDLNYINASGRGLTEGFTEGQLAGHMVFALSDRLTFFGELSASARPTQFNIEVERTILRYDFDDALKVSAGRYHTPVNYWNTAFHHGQWLQTTATRPELIKFGGSFLPAHFVGLLAEGSLGTPLGLGYSAGFGNGRGTTISRAGDAGDANSNRAWVASAHVRPPSLFGLQLGGSAYHDRVNAGATAYREQIWSAHAALWRETPEVIAEYARVGHEPIADTGSEMVNNNAYYVQVAYRLPGRASAFKPYARHERVDVESADRLFAPLLLNYRGTTVGVRYDFTPYSALKAEYRNERHQAFGNDRRHVLFLQASFSFPAEQGPLVSSDHDH